MDHFFSCDWGTSSFRLRLINTETLKVVAEETAGQGIAEVHKQWQQQNDGSNRFDFYATIIKDQIKKIGEMTGMVAEGVPVILSGMASSSIGMMDLEYKELPFKLDGSDLKTEFFSSDLIDHPFIIVSGARTDCDVMRGEETKIVGCASLLKNPGQDQLMILPGTHPKHIVIKDNKVTSFRTYMTGEFFDLLSKQSILSTSVETGGDFSRPENQEHFIRGIEASLSSNLLHNAFMVRTNQVLKGIPVQDNLYYLSGLLIGTELAALDPKIPIYLVSSTTHSSFYRLACRHLRLNIVEEMDADYALIKGHQTILSGR